MLRSSLLRFAAIAATAGIATGASASAALADRHHDRPVVRHDRHWHDPHWHGPAVVVAPPAYYAPPPVVYAPPPPPPFGLGFNINIR